MSDTRYDRQKRLSQIGAEGQSLIAKATVAVVGCGALGSVAAELLARAGVGHLLLIDRDIVQWSNLQRQLLYTERDARQGVAKADAAARHLRRINSEIRLTPHVLDLGPANVLDLLSMADFWVDGTDNFEIRFLLNDASLHFRKPWVHGGCVGTHGQVAVFWPGLTACFQCLVPMAPPVGSTDTCDSVGVLGPATTVIAALQTAAALRLIVEGQNAAADAGALHSVDVWNPTLRTLKTRNLMKNGCSACRDGILEHLAGKTVVPQVLCGQNAVQFPPHQGSSVDLDLLYTKLSSLGAAQRNPYFVRWTGDERRITVFRDGRIVVEGTQEISHARGIIHQLLGG